MIKFSCPGGRIPVVSLVWPDHCSSIGNTPAQVEDLYSDCLAVGDTERYLVRHRLKFVGAHFREQVYTPLECKCARTTVPCIWPLEGGVNLAF